PMDSVLGMDSEIIVRRFITGLPERFQLAKGEASLQGAVLEIDAATGRALAILRFCRGADEI
ncbi:MAG: YmdB family metallophosphoesterase, partial [Desulfovibrionales bacterium]